MGTLEVVSAVAVTVAIVSTAAVTGCHLAHRHLRRRDIRNYEQDTAFMQSLARSALALERRVEALEARGRNTSESPRKEESVVMTGR